MKVAIIDADLVGRKKHRFPNLACMKLSGYHKKQGDDVSLKQDYDKLDVFDLVYISKVFTDTVVPDDVLSRMVKKPLENILMSFPNDTQMRRKNGFINNISNRG